MTGFMTHDEASDLAAQRLVISGRVQGVGFRDSCRRRAEQLGLAGWVRNCGDGTVEAVVEGSVDQVAAIRSWCETGPGQARVDGVEVSDEEPTGLDGFEVR